MLPGAAQNPDATTDHDAATDHDGAALVGRGGYALGGRGRTLPSSGFAYQRQEL
jgi:hypothetical protein